ncbi:Dcp1 family protein [Aspergillus fijiensis CBS 313.89]|uniref:PH domain-like protein n=1 Tax=Aspergillus fijiensis CBS 313.89 TaxID=1448319 RepID=A0A8G1VV98_9EURO|nr:PH domain-like protein [Aspergillus fijiensis CBS 313.89]RAK74265.1 PH domain-like protein [Aspergillus fijiensis CBS 313.89]
MSARKPRRAHSNQGTNNINNPRHHQQHLSQSGFAQPSDYDSDYQAYLSDTQHHQHHQQQLPIHRHHPPQTNQQLPPMTATATTTTTTTTTTAPAPPPLRTNEDLNLSVLRRHNPTITSILSLAQYAVVYIFSPSTRQWEKSGVEGTLFVCQRSQGELGEERYSVFVLNRRGLNNFDLPLTDGDNVEITEEYIILKSDLAPEVVENASIPGMVPPANSTAAAAAAAKPSGNSGGNGGDIRIYGLWIYSEPPPNSTAETRSINAQMIRECAVHAGESLKLARERVEATRQNGMHVAAATAAVAATTGAPLEEVSTSVAMGRQVSLKDLFGQQRAQDDGWSVRAHQIAPADWQHAPPPPSQPGPGPGPGSGSGAVPALQQDVLGDLFRRAGLAYQGGQ